MGFWFYRFWIRPSPAGRCPVSHPYLLPNWASGPTLPRPSGPLAVSSSSEHLLNEGFSYPSDQSRLHLLSIFQKNWILPIMSVRFHSLSSLIQKLPYYHFSNVTNGKVNTQISSLTRSPVICSFLCSISMAHTRLRSHTTLGLLLLRAS